MAGETGAESVEDMPVGRLCMWVQQIAWDILFFSLDGNISTDDQEETLPTMMKAVRSHFKECSRCRKKWEESAAKMREAYNVPPKRS
jgi:hypothetical protein